MATESQQIMDQLKSIKEELDYIKDNMVDKRMVLDAEELQLLRESFEHERKGELTSQEDFEKELGL